MAKGSELLSNTHLFAITAQTETSMVQREIKVLRLLVLPSVTIRLLTPNARMMRMLILRRKEAMLPKRKNYEGSQQTQRKNRKTIIMIEPAHQART